MALVFGVMVLPELLFHYSGNVLILSQSLKS